MRSEDSKLALGLTRCASDCLEALECLLRERMSSLSIGILAGHCLEAALKAHLASSGWTEAQLKSLGHDLLKAWEATRSVGVQISDPPPRWLAGINFSHSGLRYRYPEAFDQPWLPHGDDYMDVLTDIVEPLVKQYLRRDWIDDGL